MVGVPVLSQVPLAELLAEADHVVCLAGATAETENLMDAAAFAAMKPTAFFINASRGDLVDEAALLQALDGGVIAGCALDVGRAPDQMPSPEAGTPPARDRHAAHRWPDAGRRSSTRRWRPCAQVGDIVQRRVPQGAVNAASASRLARLHGRP